MNVTGPQASAGLPRWPIAILVLGLLIVSRLAFAPQYLYYFDNINFALALEEFNPSLHQPQPPGYPLFVGLSRLLHTVIGSPREVFLAAGLLGSALSLLFLWLLGREMFHERVGWLAALLLLFNPAFWLGGITHQVRVFLATGATAVTLACWRAAKKDSSPRWFYTACMLLALAGGFRPASMFMLAPVVILAGVRSGRTFRQWLTAFALGGAVTAGWLWVTIQATGGFFVYLSTLQNYATSEFSGSSMLWGGNQDSAARMFIAAVTWNGIGLLTWIWALPIARRGPAIDDWRWKSAFLAVRFLPAFLFHAIVHVGDPDQTIITAPVICLLGAVVLANTFTVVRRPYLVAAAAVVLNVVLFVRPLPGIARAASLRAVRSIDNQTQAAFTSLMELRTGRRLAVISYRSLITWRHLSYYFPDLPLVVLHQDPQASPEPRSSWFLLERTTSAPPVANGEILLPPGVNRVAFLLAPDPTLKNLLSDKGTWQEQGPFLYKQVRPGDSLRFGAYRFQVPR
ncbi:MAG: DUF2723 domain-containing protein [Acidimicrobiia bacterium]|nr:DUF2723 domain-containing protein [Acidimicrobiia bacterium]